MGNNNNSVEEEEATGIEIDTLFTHDHEDSGEYAIQNVLLDESANSIVFTGKEDIDRETNYQSIFIDQKGDVTDALDLALDEEQERRCTDLNISQNGDYLVYNCHDDGIEFSVYDMNSGETIEQIDELEEFISDIIGISNDAVVYLEASNDDNETEIILYDTNDDSMKHFSLDQLIGSDEYYYFNKYSPANNGEQFFIDAGTSVFLLDTTKETIEEIVNVDTLDEQYDTEMVITNARFSHDAKYVYYKITEATSDPSYTEHFFHQLDTGEIKSFQEFNYNSVRGFDMHGNALLEDNEQLYLYNLPSDETYIIPEIDVKTYTKYFTLAYDGEAIVYTDKERNEDDTHTQYLYRVHLGDYTSFETTRLDADKAPAEKEEIDQTEISLTEQSFDEKDAFIDLWESSTSVLFPTEFPNPVDYITNHYRGNEDDRNYLQKIYLETDSFMDDEIQFRVRQKSSSGTCTFFDDLDLVETDGGHDYYFYEYKNDDVEAAVSIDDLCYYFEAEDYSEEEMLNMAKSLQPIDSPFHELSVDNLLFPTKFPIQNPKASKPRVISYRDGESVDFLIDYRGDGENDIYMDLEIRTSEPTFFEERDDNVTLDIDGFTEAYYVKDYSQLLLYDETHYYIIKLDLDKDMVEALGTDHIEETLTEIGYSFE